MKSFLYAIWEIVEVALVAVISVLIIRSFLIQPFLVSGASMEPNFHNGDYLLIDEVSYRLKKPERGEVIVFHYPGDGNFYYIKRIIGLPGEELEAKNGKIVVYNKEFSDGLVLNESYLPPNLDTIFKGERVKLDNDHYFVMGDNRRASSDSRIWGPLPEENIIGRAFLRLLPISDYGVLPGSYEEPSN